MSDATIRAAIKTIMNTIIGIGKVNDYERWSTDAAEMVSMFKLDPANKTAPLYGWEITRDAIPQVQRITNKKYKATYTYTIKGYYALRDAVASEKLFQTIVDTVVQKFVDALIPNTEGHSVPTATKILPWMFAGVLCHHAELKMSVSEIITATPAADEDLLTIALGQYLDPETTWAMWTPNTAQLLNAIVVPTTPNGRKYKCTVAGIAHATTEPIWPVTAGATVTDGTITWTEDGTTIRVQAAITIS